jgi:uncharacterized protein (DUF362 family)
VDKLIYRILDRSLKIHAVMKRREFIRKGVGTAAFYGAALSLPVYSSVFKGFPNSPAGPFDLVAIKGGEPDAMFDQAIQAMGGMGQFVKAGQTVVLKPNIGWDVVPERAGNTNPRLVKRVVEHCFQAGAKKVVVFDNTCDKWNLCYSNSGIEKAVKDAGGNIAPGNTESYYQEVDVPDGEILKKTKVHELVMESDVFINMPVLKSHSSAKLTIAMKNLMGVVWDRMFWHRNNLHQCIADYCTFEKKPTLNIIDAYRVMMKNGPRGVSEADVALMKSMIISPDMVAADTAAAKLFGVEPTDVPYIELADSMGIGTMQLDQLNIHRIIL